MKYVANDISHMCEYLGCAAHDTNSVFCIASKYLRMINPQIVKIFIDIHLRAQNATARKAKPRHTVLWNRFGGSAGAEFKDLTGSNIALTMMGADVVIFSSFWGSFDSVLHCCSWTYNCTAVGKVR